VDEMPPVDKAYMSKAYGVNMKSHSKASNLAPLPSSLNRFYKLDECIYEIQEMVDKLEYIMVQTLT